MRGDDDGQRQVTADSFDVASAPGVPPKVHHEVIRIGPGVACKGTDCDMPTLMSAFRWNGLNLATVDKQLGRYFGTAHGVRVLSNGDLAVLQAGGRIRAITAQAGAIHVEEHAGTVHQPRGHGGWGDKQ